jgi:hypothetical protein
MTIETLEQAVVLAQNFKIRQIWREVIGNSSLFVGLFTTQQYIEYIDYQSNFEDVTKIIIQTSTIIDFSVLELFAKKFKSGLKSNLACLLNDYYIHYDYDYEKFATVVKHFAPTKQDMLKILGASNYKKYANIIEKIYYETTNI